MEKAPQKLSDFFRETSRVSRKKFRKFFAQLSFKKARAPIVGFRLT